MGEWSPDAWRKCTHLKCCHYWLPSSHPVKPRKISKHKQLKRNSSFFSSSVTYMYSLTYYMYICIYTVHVTFYKCYWKLNGKDQLKLLEMCQHFHERGACSLWNILIYSLHTEPKNRRSRAKLPPKISSAKLLLLLGEYWGVGKPQV